jgi:hypothetical protein
MIVNHHTRWGEIGVAVSAGGRARREKKNEWKRAPRARARVARCALAARVVTIAQNHGLRVRE